MPYPIPILTTAKMQNQQIVENSHGQFYEK